MLKLFVYTGDFLVVWAQRLNGDYWSTVPIAIPGSGVTIYFFLLLLSFIRLEHIQAENRRRAQAPLCNANRIINVGTVKKKKLSPRSHTLRAEEVYFLFHSPPIKKRTCNNPHHCTRLTWGAELPTSQRKRDHGGEKQKEYGINERMEEERAGKSELMSLFILNGRKIF